MKAKKLILFRNKFGLLQPGPMDAKFIKLDDKELSMINSFLRGGYIDLDDLDEWLIDEKQDWYGTNSYFIEKTNGDIVVAHEGDYDHKYAFKTKREYFVSMMKQWHKIFYESKKENWPQEVAIKIYENQKVEIIPKY